MFRLLEWFFYDVLKMKHSANRPCPHMKARLSDLSDDTAKGISRWYTRLHVDGCPGCLSTLKGLQQLRSRLLRLDSPHAAGPGEPEENLRLAPERWQAVTRSWEQTDEALANSALEGGKQTS
jgi:hypothetical protein